MTDFPPPGPPPPPGAPPPGEPAAPSRWAAAPAPGPHPAYAAGPPSGPGPVPGPPPGMLGAAHKPGAIPLRPLSLGEIYDGAFRIIRFNPRATVGSAVLVATVAMAVPVIVVSILTWTVGVTYDPTAADADQDDLVGLAITYGSLGLGALLQGLGLVLVTGMVVHVVAAAAVGRRLSLGQAWAATRGRRWRLVGLAALLGLATALLITVYVVLVAVVIATLPTVAAVVLVVVSVPAFLVLLCWFWIRVYYLPVPALMLEGRGVLDSIGRGFRLTRGTFWRVFGIALLTVVIGGVAGQVLAIPFQLGGTVGALAVGPDLALFVTILGSALAQVATTAFVAPFTSSVTSLQYVDQRMRKEAFDVELMREAGVLDR